MSSETVRSRNSPQKGPKKVLEKAARPARLERILDTPPPPTAPPTHTLAGETDRPVRAGPGACTGPRRSETAAGGPEKAETRPPLDGLWGPLTRLPGGPKGHRPPSYPSTRMGPCRVSVLGLSTRLVKCLARLVKCFASFDCLDKYAHT